MWDDNLPKQQFLPINEYKGIWTMPKVKKVFTIEVEVNSNYNDWQVMDFLKSVIEDNNGTEFSAEVLPLSISRLVTDDGIKKIVEINRQTLEDIISGKLEMP
jgi:hypothetical protein